MERTRVTILGLGIMGGGMAGRLLEAGYPLTVYNRTPAKALPFVERGARVASTPAEAAADAEIIISMVSDDDVSREIWLGKDGALSEAVPGTILVESSTVTPDWVAELNAAAEKKGLHLIDAPVTGSKQQAAAGQLLFLAGGPETVLAKITPLLQVMGRAVVHLGPTGSGARMKLINNFLSGVQAASLAEALGLIERCGLNTQQAISVLTEGAPGSPMIKTLSARMVAQNYEPNFTARLMAKDLRYAIGLAREKSQDLQTAIAALHDYETIVSNGDGDKDISVVVEKFRQKSSSASS